MSFADLPQLPADENLHTVISGEIAQEYTGKVT